MKLIRELRAENARLRALLAENMVVVHVHFFALCKHRIVLLMLYSSINLCHSVCNIWKVFKRFYFLMY